MSDRGSEQGSDHTDWAFVDDGASHEAGSASPGRSVSPGLGTDLSVPGQAAGDPPPHQEPQDQDVSTPPAGARRRRIVVAPRRSLSLSQSQRATGPRRLIETEGDPAEGDWHATKQYEEDIRRASSAFPKPKAPAHTHRHLKVLLVGEACVGKTTLANNLFAAYCREGDPDMSDGPRTVQEFTEDPEAGLTDIEVQVQPEESDPITSFHYYIQDTPPVNLAGAGDSILYYIQKQSHQYLSNEDNPTRRRPVSSFVDCRVDACLYLVPPHSLKPSDVSLMASLSKIVPVIPLLAKADAMTTSELDSFRRHVQQQLAEAEEELGQPIMYTFSGAADAAAEDFDFKGFPLATIASGSMDESIGRFWPVRTFPWGKCEAMSSIHSDVSLLKSLLFENAYEDLKALTEARYYSYRDKAYATAAAARQALPDIRDEGAQGEAFMAEPEDAPQPRRRFGWLKIKCCPWKVCAAVVVFALALSVDNLLLRREVGRQRGLHQMKNEVSLQPSSKSAGMQSSGHFGSQWQHMFGRHWWHDLPINHPKHPFFARSADPRSLQQQAPAFAGEGSKSSSKCACPPVKPENPHAGMFSRGPHKRAAAKPADHVLQHQELAHEGDGYFQKVWGHRYQKEQRLSTEEGPQAASQKHKSWQQEVQELLWLPSDEALPHLLWQIDGRIKGCWQHMEHGRKRLQRAMKEARHRLKNLNEHAFW